MKIYNSLTDKLEEFKPIVPGEVSMYVCGPTVYNYVHIGNMRPVITFDMVYNYLKYSGYKVTYASNFTDVNPKIINAAKELSITEREVAEKFIDAYLADVASYNCSNIDYRPKVIDCMDDIYNFINALIECGKAYVVDQDVYFRVNSLEEYGKLSNQDTEELISGARVDIDERKESPLDFALWRSTDSGEQFQSPWGLGIPGWHTECVVMINKLFGNTIDIHGGGIDLKFPHHENEVAQSMALHNVSLANFWMHNGHINLDGEKMSKSLGNFILAKDFIKEHSANIVKLALFKTHYRLPLNFTDALFADAESIDDKVYNVLKQANVEIIMNNLTVGVNTIDNKINEIMDEDFNTPNLITLLLDTVKELNNMIRNHGDIVSSYDRIQLINKILGLKYDLVNMDDSMKELYTSWISLRNEKKFEEADLIRKELVNKNIL